MMFAVLTMVLTADNKEQLDADTETVQAIARKHMCQLAVLKYQQLDGLNTCLLYTSQARSTAFLSVFSLQRLIWAALRVKSNAAAARKPQRNFRNRSAAQPSRICLLYTSRCV